MANPLDDILDELNNPRLTGLNELPPNLQTDSYFMNVFLVYDDKRAVHHKLTRYEYLRYRQEGMGRNGVSK